MTAEPDSVFAALSSARLSPYWWNVEASEAFYPALHLLEVALRNALPAQLSVMFSRSDWWVAAPLEPSTARLVAETEQNVRPRKAGVSTDDTVTELSFGFWAALVGRKYDRALGVPGLHRALPYHHGRRSTLHQTLFTVVLLRNRIMHHEPIHHRHLEADRASVRLLLGFVSPELIRALDGHDRLADVLARRPAPVNPREATKSPPCARRWRHSTWPRTGVTGVS